ncbi:hypothetical protein A2870_02670 [Candidatus Curtissbacteria bacterium RIFCSPHIGHO2_01_FULL_41_11]|uniref:Uncharacterized protein n=1 Tax=Candidatus Curtissbacteria bacterium RIFCSPHIGHO2_01_FULL_41_11 TaxID=1797711 RepID=A0A1F5G3S4_9BACT|nr:MAG: hypothetical protein A2870_02670 [Candidatus Curtissbacteria bacterium RIFCSPHIGHO2_01_FULL_41_11]
MTTDRETRTPTKELVKIAYQAYIDTLSSIEKEAERAENIDTPKIEEFGNMIKRRVLNLYLAILSHDSNGVQGTQTEVASFSEEDNSLTVAFFFTSGTQLKLVPGRIIADKKWFRGEKHRRKLDKSKMREANLPYWFYCERANPKIFGHLLTNNLGSLKNQLISYEQL